MCYRVEIKANIKEIAKRYNATVDNTAEELLEITSGDWYRFGAKTIRSRKTL